MLEPERRREHLAHGQALVEMRRYWEAIPVLRRATAHDPEDFGAHCLLAQALFNVGLQAQALRGADRAVDVEPRNVHGHILRGVILLGMNRAGAAAAAAWEAARLGPDDAAAFTLLARAELSNRNLAMARWAAERAAELSPDSAEPHAVLALVAAREEDWNEAVEHAREALRVEPDNYEALALLEVAFERMQVPQDERQRELEHLRALATTTSDTVVPDRKDLRSEARRPLVLGLLGLGLVNLTAHALITDGHHVDAPPVIGILVGVLACAALIGARIRARLIRRLAPAARAYVARHAGSHRTAAALLAVAALSALGLWLRLWLIDPVANAPRGGYWGLLFALLALAITAAADAIRPRHDVRRRDAQDVADGAPGDGARFELHLDPVPPEARRTGARTTEQRP